MGSADREREEEYRCWTIQSQAERGDRGQTEKSWLLFEGIDTFLYDLTRKSKPFSGIVFGDERDGNPEASMVRANAAIILFCRLSLLDATEVPTWKSGRRRNAAARRPKAL